MSAKQNYETYDTKLLAIVLGFWIWHYYLKKVAHTILVLTNHENLKKFIETTCLSKKQIQWALELLCYNFKINYYSRSKNLANVLSQSLIDKDIEKEMVEKNWKILNKL